MKIDIDMMDLDGIARFLSGSHRGLHLVCGLAVGLLFGLGAALVAAGALEFKDCQYDRWNAQYGVKVWKWRWKSWDWVDFACTVAGGLLGSLVRWLVIGRFM